MQSIRYPAIQVKLIGRDGNALTVVAAVSRALEQAGVGQVEITNFGVVRNRVTREAGLVLSG
jgi:hypothetical protein